MLRTLVVALVACSTPATRGGMPTEGDPKPTLVETWNRHFPKGETGPGMCALTGFDKSCKIDMDCSIVEDVLDECRTTAQLGVNARGRAAFEARPTHDPCAGKRCPSCVVRWTFTEDCAAASRPVVGCVKGTCMTHAADPAD